MDFYRDASPIIFDHDCTIIMNAHRYLGAAASHGFINAIVDDFIHQMVQSMLVGAANIHAWSSAYCLPSPQNLDILSGILIIFWLSLGRDFLGHNWSSPLIGNEDSKKENRLGYSVKLMKSG